VLVAGNLENVQVCPGRVGLEISVHCLEPCDADMASPGKWSDFLLGRAWPVLQGVNLVLGQP
jgi:hypothetical protein